jgi:uridine kinase
VDGPAGSGKSTLAHLLSEQSGAPVVRIDDFLSWTDLDGWWPRFDDEVLQPLLAGRDARYRIRDWAGDEFGSAVAGWKTTSWNTLVIIEGVTCTRLATLEALTYRIWVEAPASVRLERGVARDGESHRALWERWMTLEDEFFARDRTRARADLVVDTHSGIT